MSPVETPELEENRAFNLLTSIWIVPLIALIISGWLVYQHFSQLGPELRIDFPSSDGLVAGESAIKFRDVTVGKIVRIELQKGGDGVTVVARMNKEVEPYINRTTRFWIVTPQVDYTGVRGLDTLIHGAYITMYASGKGKLIEHFKGLEKPYRPKDQGSYFHLRTREIGNVHVGAPVYYRNLRAGSIEKIALGPDKRATDVTIFLTKEYANLINVTTKFWHQDLVAVSFDGGEIALDLAPLTSVLLGSISFESKLDNAYPKPSTGHVFRLYNKHSDALKQKIGGTVEHFQRFRFAFSGEVNGLREGSAIRYQGFKVGEIDKTEVGYNSHDRMMEAEVIGLIDTSIFKDKEANGTTNLERAVQKGLRAELKSGNPLVESLYIDLDYPTDTNTTAASRHLIAQGGVIDFPTRKMVKNEILSKLDHLLVSITALADDNRQPLHDLLNKLKQSADHLNGLMGKKSFQNLTDDLNQTMGGLNGFVGKSGELNKALEELRKTLRTTKRVMRGYSAGSLFGKKMEAMLREVGRTSEETKRLIEKLNKKPNALIFGE